MIIPHTLRNCDENIGSSVDLFKFKVLLNQEMHSLLTRFCFQEFSESTIFLFDAIQDFKSEEDEDYRRRILTDAYDEYISRESKRSIASVMGDSLYEASFHMISLVSSGYYTCEDIDPVVTDLEEFLLGQLMQTYERFTSKKVDRRQSLPKLRITTIPPSLRPWGSMTRIHSPTTPKKRRKVLDKARSNWISLMRWFLGRNVNM
jgi:hypothetical protein